MEAKGAKFIKAVYPWRIYELNSFYVRVPAFDILKPNDLVILNARLLTIDEAVKKKSL